MRNTAQMATRPSGVTHGVNEATTNRKESQWERFVQEKDGREHMCR